MAKGSRSTKSLREFSRLAGVSAATVSRVSSNQGNVAPDTEQRILKLAEAVGFRPSAIGRVAFGGQTHSVGVLLPSLRVSFFADIAAGLQIPLLNQDYLPMILQLWPADEQKAVQRLLDHRVDALVVNLVDESLTTRDFAIITKSQLPLVLLGPWHAGLTADNIASDDVLGGRLAGRHLLALGHKRIGFGYFGEGHSSADLRQAGLTAALESSGLTLRKEDIARLPPHSANRDAEFAAQTRVILRRADRPTAFFASTDTLAKLVYQVARELKLHIPRDLSIVGFADLDFAPLIDPPLTTIHQNGMEFGKQAAEMVLRRLQNPNLPQQSMLMPTHLVVRQSTASPAALRG